MKVWIDPEETAVDAWSGVNDEEMAAAPSLAASVMERAVSTRPPAQYTDGAYLTPASEGADGTERGGYARSASTARSIVRRRSN